MDLNNVVNRNRDPKPWTEGDNIPWNDADFSRRMLREHLSQDHDAASRRSDIIDRQVEWIHTHILKGTPSRILDLACGPGLYTSRLASMGHKCNGIDYSPASISYAKEIALEKDLEIEYIHADIRNAEFPLDQDLVLFISGELNVFSPSDAEAILDKISGSLANNGRLVLEVHGPGVIEANGSAPDSWSSMSSGLWSGSPYICLQDNHWRPDLKAAVVRYYLIDPATGDVKLHSASYQDYSNEEYRSILSGCGFNNVEMYPSLTGAEDDQMEYFRVIVAEK